MIRMPRNRKIDEIRSVDLFSSCTDAELHAVARLCDTVDLVAGAVLTRAGRRTRAFLVIVDGETFEGHGPGDHVGEHELLTDTPADETVVTATTLRVLAFESRTFATLLQRVPVVAVKLLREYADAFEAADEAETLERAVA